MGKIVYETRTNCICAAVPNGATLILTQNGLKTPDYLDPFRTSATHAVVKNVDIPEDFEPHKYMYVDGQVVLNEGFEQMIKDRNHQKLLKIKENEKRDEDVRHGKKGRK